MSQSGPVSLTEPKAKRCRIPVQQALPIPLASLTGQPATQDLWQWYHGRLLISKEQGMSSAHVLIENGEEANAVYSNGYYGLLDCKDEGESFNRRKEEVKLVQKNWTPGMDFEVLEEKDNEVDWLEGDESMINSNPNEEEANETEPGGDRLDDKVDSPANIDNEPSKCWGDMKNLNQLEQDSLRLELCEAFFLSWALGCLLVSKGGDQMNLANMWKEFTRIEPDFIWRYSVYHHFRAKGWVVRSGQKFGVDWLLYKHGPPHYHASYSVRVELATKHGKSTSVHIPSSSWLSLAGLTRVCQTTGKELLVARVEAPRLREADLSSPDCLKKLSITELRVRPWVPAIERWDEKPSVPVVAKKQSGFKTGIVSKQACFKPVASNKQASLKSNPVYKHPNFKPVDVNKKVGFKQNRNDQQLRSVDQEFRKRKQPP